MTITIILPQLQIVAISYQKMYMQCYPDVKFWKNLIII